MRRVGFAVVVGLLLGANPAASETKAHQAMKSDQPVAPAERQSITGQEVSVGISIIALLLSATTLVIFAYVNVSRPRKSNKIRRWLFAHEAVHLHERWVQFARQVLQERPMLSLSRPYEWIQFGTIEEFLRTGGERSVVNAVYRVKQLRYQVNLQIERAQEAGADQKAIIRALPADPKRWSESDRQVEGIAIKTFHENLNYIAAFILADNEWPEVCREIEHLIKEAEKHGNDVAALRQSFKARKEEGERLYADWQARRQANVPVA